MWHNDMCCINNSISCLEKKTTLGTHEQTCYVDFNVGSPPPFFICEVHPSRAYWSTFSLACYTLHYTVRLSLLIHLSGESEFLNWLLYCQVYTVLYSRTVSILSLYNCSSHEMAYMDTEYFPFRLTGHPSYL